MPRLDQKTHHCQRRLGCLLACFMTVAAVAAQNSLAEEHAIAAADLMPESTVAFVEITRARDIIDVILSHPGRAKVEALPQMVEAKKSKQYTAFRGGVALFEASMAMTWKDAIRSLTDQGVFVGIDAETEGVIMLTKTSAPEVAERFIDTMVSTLKIAGGAKVKEVEYDRFRAFAIDEVKFAQLDNWMLLTNKADLGKATLDRYIAIAQPDAAASSGSLAENDSFSEALRSRAPCSVWGFLDVAFVRDSGAAPELYSGKAENILVEAILGGILSNLTETPSATAELSISDISADFRLKVPHDKSWAGQREYFFGPDGSGRAPEHLTSRNQIASLTAYRGLSEMWLRAGDLLTDKAADELATADSTLSTFFSGRDFGEDILGELAPEIQLIVSQQEFASGDPTPAIKLPAFALQFRMNSPEKMRPEMRRVFVSLCGFLNVVGAMEGQPQLDFSFDNIDAAEIISTNYLPPENGLGSSSTNAAINYNFSPSIGFRGDRIVVSSTASLAHELINSPSDSNTRSSDDGPNTDVKISMPAVAQALHANRQQLVAQNMLEKGHNQKAAEDEIDLLLNLLSLVDGITLELSADDYLEFDLQVEFAAQ